MADATSGAKVVLVTSPQPADGKTTVAVNLARAIAVRNRTVLLIDADLRRPRVHHELGVAQAEKGVSALLQGAASLREVLVRSDVAMLSYIPSGAIAWSAPALLQSEAFTRLLVSCAKDFDHVIVDSPPLVAAGDVEAIAARVDGVLLVARPGATTIGSLRSALRKLELRTKVLGVVLNQVQDDTGYYSYYGDSHGYATEKKASVAQVPKEPRLNGSGTPEQSPSAQDETDLSSKP